MEKIMTERERANAYNEILNPKSAEAFIKGCTPYELMQILEFAEKEKDISQKIVERFAYEGTCSGLTDLSSEERFNFFAQRNNNYQNAITAIQTIKNNLEPKPQIEVSKKGTASYEEILSKIKKYENKFWKGLPMEKVISHFEVMTTKKNKDGRPYLSQKQFISFLKRGFLNDKNQPVQKINCSAGEKGFVIKRFYEFYDLANSQYSYPARKEKFINLFTDCFDNWEPGTIESFFKRDKVKDKW